MANKRRLYDPGLAARLEDILAGCPGFRPRTMFGGICWMLNGNMCVGIHKDWLIIRVGEAAAASLAAERHVKPMDVTGKVMRGWAMVSVEGLAEDAELKRFTALAIGFVSLLPAKG